MTMQENACPHCCGRKKERSPEEYKKLIHRLNRIEGQIRGIRGMLENDAYFVDMALNDYPILYRSALDPESDQLIRHAYQKSRSILSFYNKMRFAFFSRSKALYYFIERRNCNLARYDNC